jgi:hypothetical protein
MRVAGKGGFMFNRKYNDRRKSRPTARTIYYKARGSVLAFNAFKLTRSAPIEETGSDGEVYPWMSKAWSDVLLTTLTPEQLKAYTVPQPFCIVPTGGAKPKTHGGKMAFRNPTEREAFRSLLKGMKAEVKAKQKTTLPPLPTFEEAIEKAGGRTVSAADNIKMNAYLSLGIDEVTGWHELDA